MRRTKIVATLGPASRSRATLHDLISSGADVVRLNFSHASIDEHRESLELVRDVSKALARSVAVLQDLQGPKIRIGDVAGGHVALRPGNEIVLTSDAVSGSEHRVSVSYPKLAEVVHEGDPILLDDGLLELEVRQVRDHDVVCVVILGGPLRSRKGVNLPKSATTLPAITEKDEKDLEAGVEMGVDYIALSFVRTASDVLDLRQRLEKIGAAIPIIAKIKKPQAVDNLEAILQAADGVMVARGDLGVEMAPARVPLIQKRIVRLALRDGKLVIIATQMLESMTYQPRPTRAEASDVANAILDGTDAVMLSAETATGKYPVQTVEQMKRIALATEPALFEDRPAHRPMGGCPSDTHAVIQAAVLAADQLDARALVVFTESGRTARILSSLRPENPIFAFTHVEATLRKLALVWGVEPLVMPRAESTAELLQGAEERLLQRGLVDPGDRVVMIAGYSIAEGAANMMKVHRIGNR